MTEASLVERIWFGDDMLMRIARLALWPLEVVYRATTSTRGALYSTGVLSSRQMVLPAISIGNLSVGGTGKTPIAAWVASRLLERGAQPAIVLRGYGEDEPLVHRILNPGAPVVVSADRVVGAERARKAGANVVVLDDAFQHRRARRDVDVVLVSADRWPRTQRLLPAGPWREPLGALRRASAIVITRKAVGNERVEEVERAIERAAPNVPRAVAHLAIGELVDASNGKRMPQARLESADVRVISGIGDAAAFVRQLTNSGARVSAQTYPDHHHFTDAEVEGFVRALPPAGLAVCTLKDSVKLSPRWPRAAPPLWYVSQHVVFERGGEVLHDLLDELMRARSLLPSTAG